MWILDWLPFWIFHLVVVLGISGIIASVVFKFIPFISQYTLPIQVVSIIVLAFGVYMEGGISNQQMWEAKVAKLESQVKISEEQSKTANAKIGAAVKENVRIVKEVQVIIQERIKEAEAKIDAECKVAPEVLNILNDAASKPGVNK